MPTLYMYNYNVLEWGKCTRFEKDVKRKQERERESEREREIERECV